MDEQIALNNEILKRNKTTHSRNKCESLCYIERKNAYCIISFI